MKHPTLCTLLLVALLPSCQTFNREAYAPASPPLAGASLNASSTLQEGEKIIRTGSMSMKTRDLKKSSDVCISLVATHKATIQSAHLTENDYSATIRVPSTELKPLMTSLADVGKITSQRVSSDNVTAEYLDLEALLKNKRALRDRFRQLLTKADTVKDTLSIEKELTKVQTELDQLESRMKLLRSRAALSTLNIDIDRETIPGPVGVVTKSSGWLLKKLFVLN